MLKAVLSAAFTCHYSWIFPESVPHCCICYRLFETPFRVFICWMNSLFPCSCSTFSAPQTIFLTMLPYPTLLLYIVDLCEWTSTDLILWSLVYNPASCFLYRSLPSRPHPAVWLWIIICSPRQRGGLRHSKAETVVPLPFAKWRKLNWFGHVARHDTLSKLLMQGYMLKSTIPKLEKNKATKQNTKKQQKKTKKPQKTKTTLAGEGRIVDWLPSKRWSKGCTRSVRTARLWAVLLVERVVSTGWRWWRWCINLVNC